MSHDPAVAPEPAAIAEPAVASHPATPPVMPPGFRVLPAPTPPSLDHPDAWAILGRAEVWREIFVEIHGHSDIAAPPAEVLAALADPAAIRHHWVAVPADRPPEALAPHDVIACASANLPVRDNTHRGEIGVGVRPEFRRRGVGQALLDLALHTMADAGRTVAAVNSDHGPEPAPGPGTLTAASGDGRIPAADAAARFALKNGFTFEQAQRFSTLALPVDPARLAALGLDAHSRATGYRVLIWREEVPDEWIDQFAALHARMSTDAPSAGLDVTEEVWDAQRVREAERRVLAAGSQSLTVVAARGDVLAAFTNVECPPSSPQVVYQQDTLVAPEHRGRRLGMGVKVAMLEELAKIRPEARRMHTWNAEENEHMLAINTALGFAPAGVEATWQRRLTAASAATCVESRQL